MNGKLSLQFLMRKDERRSKQRDKKSCFYKIWMSMENSDLKQQTYGWKRAKTKS